MDLKKMMFMEYIYILCIIIRIDLNKNKAVGYHL